MRIFSLHTCDTCKTAMKELRDKGHQLEVIDVRADGVNSQDLAKIATTFGADAINKKSKTWRELSDEEKEKDRMTLLKDHPLLMKRPVIERDGQMFLGWNDEVREELL